MTKAKARERAKAKAPEKAKKRAAAAAAAKAAETEHPGSFTPGNQSIKGPTSKANRNAGAPAKRGSARSK